MSRNPIRITGGPRRGQLGHGTAISSDIQKKRHTFASSRARQSSLRIVVMKVNQADSTTASSSSDNPCCEGRSILCAAVAASEIRPSRGRSATRAKCIPTYECDPYSMTRRHLTL
jgi:hypothetical protein